MDNDNHDDNDLNTDNYLPFMPDPDKLPDGLNVLDVMVTVLTNASEAAKAVAEAKPGEDGRVIVGLVFEKDGSIAIAKNGLPLTTTLPVRLLEEIDDGNVLRLGFEHEPERMVSPKEAADQLGVSIKTLQRLRYEGVLADPQQISSRRVGWPQSDLYRILTNGGVAGMRKIKEDEARAQTKKKKTRRCGSGK
mgnify:FL=1